MNEFSEIDYSKIELKKCTKLGPLTKNFVKSLNDYSNAGPALMEQYEVDFSVLRTYNYFQPKHGDALLKNPLIIRDFSKFPVEETDEIKKIKFRRVEQRAVDGIFASIFIFDSYPFSLKKSDPIKDKELTRKICNEIFEERYNDVVCLSEADYLWTQVITIADMPKNKITILMYTVPN